MIVALILAGCGPDEGPNARPPAEETTWTYDAEGRSLTRDELRTLGDEVEEEHERYTYDAEGRTLTRDEVRIDGPDTEADHDVWTWACP